MIAETEIGDIDRQKKFADLYFDEVRFGASFGDEIHNLIILLIFSFFFVSFSMSNIVREKQIYNVPFQYILKNTSMKIHWRLQMCSVT